MKVGNFPLTHEQEFPVGCRVVVQCAPQDGSDYNFQGRAGVIVRHGQFFEVRFDKRLRDWPNPAMINPGHLAKETEAYT